MDFCPELLTAEWQGKSSSPQDPTTWSNTYLLFTCISSAPTAPNRKVYAIDGRGVSLWKGHRIDFTIGGHLDSFTKKFELKKRHQGKYNNEITYIGNVDVTRHPENGESVFRMRGSYHNGTICLVQCRGGPYRLLSSLLSGFAWRGVSISLNSDRTHWSDVQLEFTPPPTLKYYLENEGKDTTDIYDPAVISAISTASIRGSGVSLWKSMNIDFEIKGRIDFVSGEVHLIKEHKGQYTNIVEYKCKINPSNMSIDGTFGSGGTFELKVSGAIIDEDNVSGFEDWRKMSAQLLEKSWQRLEAYTEEALSLYAAEAEAAAEVKDLQVVAESKEDDDDEEEEESKTSLDDNSYDGGRDLSYRGPGERLRESDDEEDDEDEDEQDEDVAEDEAFYHDDYQDLEDDEFIAAMSLREDAKQEERGLCKICFENKANVIFVPCGHFMSCVDCGNKCDLCPICRVPINLAQEVFES